MIWSFAFHITICTYTIIYVWMFYAIKVYLHFFSLHLLHAFTCQSSYTNVPPVTTNMDIFECCLKITPVVAQKENAFERNCFVPWQFFVIVGGLVAYVNHIDFQLSTLLVASSVLYLRFSDLAASSEKWNIVIFLKNEVIVNEGSKALFWCENWGIRPLISYTMYSNNCTEKRNQLCKSNSLVITPFSFP